MSTAFVQFTMSVMRWRRTQKREMFRTIRATYSGSVARAARMAATMPRCWMRWRGPLGLLRADVAYGEEVHDVRLHLSVGIAF